MELQRALREAGDPKVVMQRIAEGALQLIPAADGATVELVEDEALVCACCAGTLTSMVGARLRLGNSLSGLAVGTGSTLSCQNTETDPRVDRDLCRRVGASSMVCVPLRRGGEAVGVLKVTSSSTRAFDGRDVATLTGLAEFVTAAITATSELFRATDAAFSASTGDFDAGRGHGTARISAFVAGVVHPGMAAAVEAATRIEHAMATGAFVPVFQPVLDLRTQRLVGAEALTRFLPGPYRTPDRWFAEAHQVGKGVELELAAIDKALRFAVQLPPSCYLAVNIGPEALVSTALIAVLEAVDPKQVVVELTEHDRIDDYRPVQARLRELREEGVRLAIDDAGAGFASLSHVVKLAPDVIKVDLELIRGIDLDPARRSLLTAVVSFADDIGAAVVAEGIETEAECETLCRLGVASGQGYLLGHPGPPEMLDAYRPRDGRASSPRS